MRHLIGLLHLQKQNSWQSQWLLFATTNKRDTGIFQNVLTTFNSPQNSITITIQAKLLWTLETAKEAKVETLIFTAHAHCFKLKRNLQTGKLPDNKAF